MLSMDFVLRLPALLVALAFHEYAHARVAYALGDMTPRYQGRLTLNPLAHLDPVGLLMLWVFRFGWARPVQINPFNFANPRRGMLLASMAGPLANVGLAFLSLVALRAGIVPGGVWTSLVDLLFSYNLVFAAFNLIPVPPLDGSRILSGLLPDRAAAALRGLERYGWLILVGLIWTGAIGSIMSPLMGGLFRVLDIAARAVTGRL